MKSNDRSLGIAAALSIAAAMLAVSGMTIIAIAAVFAAPTTAGGAPARDLTADLLLGALMSALTLFVLAQIVARRYFIFANFYSRPISPSVLGLMCVVTLALTVMFAVFMNNTIERIGRNGGPSVVGSVFFPSLGSNMTLLAMMWANLANLFFMHWRQSLSAWRDVCTEAVATRVA